MHNNHGPLTTYWVSEKTNEPLPTKLSDRKMEGRKDRQALLYRTLSATADSPKMKLDKNIKKDSQASLWRI